MKSISAIAAGVTLSVSLLGCVQKPVTAPRAVVPETTPSELRVSATAAKKFGHMLAIGVGVSNGSTRDYAITADRVLALDKYGNRIAALSVEEAARQAGGANALAAGLKGAAGTGLLTGLLGAATGAIIGAGTGSPGTGAAVGAGIGMAGGAIGGFYESKSKTEREIIDQLGGLYLAAQTSKPGLPVSGFVFFPEGEYVGVYVIAVEQPEGTPREIFGPMIQPAT
jgi:hypothetical protein